MKKRLLFLFFVHVFIGYAQDTIPLKPCPSSPNCVCTYPEKVRKSAPTLAFKGTLDESRAALIKLISNLEGAVLVDENSTYLHFEFHTSIGHFIDDVEFYFDEENKTIHYRSASRMGYGDFGANKRRMKKVSQLWHN